MGVGYSPVYNYIQLTLNSRNRYKIYMGSKFFTLLQTTLQQALAKMQWYCCNY